MATPEKEGTDALRADVERLRADIATITETLKGMAGAEWSEATERLRRATESARHEGEHLAKAAMRRVEERPLTSVLAGFVVGLLLGLLVGRRG